MKTLRKRISKSNNICSLKELISMANDKTNWRNRLDAVHKIKNFDCDEVRDILVRLALSDRVYRVKKEAYKIANELNLKQNGKPIYLGKKHTGYSIKEFKDQFVIIRRELKENKLNIHEFKEKFKEINPEMYDVMECEKGNKFDYWIKDIYTNLPQNK